MKKPHSGLLGTVFCHYAEERKGILHWGTAPELDDRSRCYFYMRCLISDATSADV
jgi:hypothetical protein